MSVVATAACPRPDKTAYTEADAKREAARLTHDARVGHRDAYPCSCGAWHLTGGESLNAKIARALRPRR